VKATSIKDFLLPCVQCCSGTGGLALTGRGLPPNRTRVGRRRRQQGRFISAKRRARRGGSARPARLLDAEGRARDGLQHLLLVVDGAAAVGDHVGGIVGRHREGVNVPPRDREPEVVADGGSPRPVRHCCIVRVTVCPLTRPRHVHEFSAGVGDDSGALIWTTRRPDVAGGPYLLARAGREGHREESSPVTYSLRFRALNAIPAGLTRRWRATHRRLPSPVRKAITTVFAYLVART